MDHIFFDGYFIEDGDVEFFIRDKISHDRKEVRSFEDVFNLEGSFFSVDTIKVDVIKLL